MVESMARIVITTMSSTRVKAKEIKNFLEKRKNKFLVFFVPVGKEVGNM